MQGLLLASVLALICLVCVSASQRQVCREINRTGRCSTRLEQTGRVCGTDGRTYRNQCVLEKKNCRLSLSIRVVKYESCTPVRTQPINTPAQQRQRPRQQRPNQGGRWQQSGGRGGEVYDNYPYRPPSRPSWQQNQGQNRPYWQQSQEQNRQNWQIQPQVGEPGDDGYPYVQQNYPNQPQINEPVDTPDGTDAPDMPDYNDNYPGAPQNVPPGGVTSGSSEEVGAGGAGGAGGGGGAPYNDPCSPNAPECELRQDPVCTRKGREYITFYNRCFFDKEKCFDPALTFVRTGSCYPRAPARMHLPRHVQSPRQYPGQNQYQYPRRYPY